jgi:ATP-dependent Clp protease ATP-binding subunit ClpA
LVIYNEIKNEIMLMLRQQLKPEFLNRIDEIIIFHSLSRADIEKIVDLQMAVVEHQLADQGLTVRLTDRAKKYLGDRGYDPAFGARPLKRIIQKEILDKLALEILERKFSRGEEILVDFEKDQIVIKSAEKETIKA